MLQCINLNKPHTHISVNKDGKQLTKNNDNVHESSRKMNAYNLFLKQGMIETLEIVE